MTLAQLLRILRARLTVFAIALLTVVAVATAVNHFVPKTYKATATLVLNYKGVDAVTGTMMPAQMMPTYMATQIEIIKSKNVALKVVEKLQLANDPTVQQEFYSSARGEGDLRDWVAGLLLKHLTVLPARDSSVFDIQFKGTDPQFAALVANTFASEYQQITIQLKANPLRQASNYFNEQIKAQRENFESAQKRLSEYQQKNGLVSVDNRLDVESGRLNDLSSQLVLVQGQLMDAMSRQRQALGDSGAESPDVIANPLVQSLKSSLAQAEARFSEISQKLGENHPQYQGAQAEVAKLRAALHDHIRATSNSVANNARILQQREAELRAALDRQKNKVLELNRARDQLTVLVREVESAQRAYDTTTLRFNQTSLEGHANQNEVAVLNPAVPPMEPTGPKPIVNLLLSVVMGCLLGLGLAVVVELIDRRARCSLDVADALNAPVFGTILWTPGEPKRLRFLRGLGPRRLRTS